MSLCSKTVLGTLCLKVCGDPCGGGCYSRRVAPWLASHLTAKSITELLRQGGHLEDDNSVVSVETIPFAAGEGLLSTLFRLKCTYECETDLPNSFVCKLSPTEVKARIICEVLGLFLTEAEYYKRDFRLYTGLDSPKCYYAGKDSFGRFCCLLEDMAPAKTGNQVDGVEIEQATECIQIIARLHAKFRGNVENDPKLDFVCRIDDRTYWDLVADAYKKAMKQLAKNCRKFRCTNVDGFPKFGVDWFHYWDNFMRVLRLKESRFVPTLLHGDFRAVNIFFNSPTTIGDNPGTKGVRFIDFQLLKSGFGAHELHYFLSSSLTIEKRKKEEPKLLQLYYETLVKKEVDITFEDVVREYQMGAATPLIVWVIGANDTDTSSENGSLIVRKMLERAWSSIQDWNYVNASKMLFENPDLASFKRQLTKEERNQLLPAQYCKMIESMSGK
eukprot:g4488.t1